MFHFVFSLSGSKIVNVIATLNEKIKLQTITLNKLFLDHFSYSFLFQTIEQILGDKKSIYIFNFCYKSLKMFIINVKDQF